MLHIAASTFQAAPCCPRRRLSRPAHVALYDPELLIIDDLGLRLSRDDEPIDLYEIIRTRYERSATLITSNRSAPEMADCLAIPFSQARPWIACSTTPTFFVDAARLSARQGFGATEVIAVDGVLAGALLADGTVLKTCRSCRDRRPETRSDRAEGWRSGKKARPARRLARGRRAR